MAKKPHEIYKQAEERHQRELRREKVKENRKIAKEYFRQERNARLPRLIITIIVFIILVGTFTGLYMNYDYDVDFTPREFSNIDISSSVDINSSAIKNSLLSFFSFLGSTSTALTSVTNSIVSDNSFADDYITNLYNSGYNHLFANYNWFKATFYAMQLKQYLKAVNDLNYWDVISYKVPQAHWEIAHLQDLIDLSEHYGWNALEVHNKFVELKCCHQYNGVKYIYCE